MWVFLINTTVVTSSTVDGKSKYINQIRIRIAFNKKWPDDFVCVVTCHCVLCFRVTAVMSVTAKGQCCRPLAGTVPWVYCTVTQKRKDAPTPCMTNDCNCMVYVSSCNRVDWWCWKEEILSDETKYELRLCFQQTCHPLKHLSGPDGGPLLFLKHSHSWHQLKMLPESISHCLYNLSSLGGALYLYERLYVHTRVPVHVVWCCVCSTWCVHLSMFSLS